MFARIALTAAVVVALAVSPARAEGLRTVTFIPQWLPQAQFAGYYMAHEKGLYRKAGIDAMIMRGGPQFPPSEMLSQNKVNFATLFLSSALQLHEKGIRLVNIGQIVQHSGYMLVTRKEAGIRSPLDLNGKTVGIWSEFRLQPQAFFRKYGVSVRSVPQSDSLTLFLRGGVTAASAMWYNEYHTLLNSGLNEDELQPFFFHRFGLNFPEDGLYCRREAFQRDPELCRRFALASLEGWRYAFANREETLDVVMRYVREAKVGTNRGHQKWMLERMNDLILPRGSQTALGRLQPEDYLRVAGELTRSGLISKIPPYGEFHADFTGPR